MATEWATWPRATDEELRSWSVARGDDAGRAARSHADVSAENQALRERAEAAEAELHTMKTAGIVEVAVRNPSVMEYMQHWEGRAERAERAEAAAWNDAIEAAALEAEWRIMPAFAASIRALRRAAPAEGEA